MANPITTDDFYKDTGGLEKLVKDLEKADHAYVKLVQSAVEQAETLEKTLQGFSVATADQREQIKKTASEADKVKKTWDKYNEALSNNGAELAKAREALRKQNQVNKLTIKLNSAAEGSYDRLSAQYSLIKIRLNAMSKAQRETTQEGQALVKQSAEIYEEMKRLQEETGKNTLKVGSYEEALRSLPSAASQAVDGIRGLGTAFKALLANPVVAVIAAIVGGLIALFNAFKRTERGANLLAQVTGVLSGLMSSLVGIVDRASGALVDAFQDPKQAIIDLGKLLVDQIVNRFTALPKLAIAVFTAVKEAITFNLQGAREAAEDAFFAINQAITGLDEEQQRAVFKTLVEEADQAADNAAAFARLEVAKRNVTRQNIALAKTLEGVTTEMELQNQLAGSNTLSFEQLRQAAEAAREANERRGKLEAQIARNTLSLINQEIDLRRRNGEDILELLDRQLAAYQQLAAAERSYTIAVAQNEEERRQIKQDELERDLDILIDGFDNQKTINERIIKDTEQTFEKRRALLDETRRLSDDSFRRQIQTIQEFTDVQVDANDLIATSDAVLLNQKIRSLGLSEIIEGRLLEIVRDRRTANQDLLEAERDLNKQREEADKKALALAEARLKATREAAFQEFEQRQQLAESEFALLEKSEAEKAIFQLEAERKRLQAILDINKLFGDELTAVQKQTLENQIKAIDEAIAKAKGNEGDSLLDLLGIKLKDEQKTGIKAAFDFIKGQFLDFEKFRREIADRNLAQANQEVEQAQRNLQIELQNAQAGFDARISLRERELQQAERQRAQALNEQRQAAQAEQRINNTVQTANLITAVSKIWKDLGFPLAIPAVAFMFGSFLRAKIKSAQLAKAPARTGMFEDLSYAGSHASGHDISLGVRPDGVERTAERGEGLAVFSKAAMKRYGKLIPNLVDQLNARKLATDFLTRTDSAVGGSVLVVSSNSQLDDRNIVKELKGIRSDKERNTAYLPDGSIVQTWGQNRTIIRRT